MPISLKKLELSKLPLGINKLAEAGIDVDRWLAMCDADLASMERLVDAWPIPLRSVWYDAGAILGLDSGKVAAIPRIPDPAPDELVIRVGAWSLEDLSACESDSAEKHPLMWELGLHDQPFFCRKMDPGIYYVKLHISHSINKTYRQQRSLLSPNGRVAPAALIAATLMCLLKTTGQKIDDDWIRCAEKFADKPHKAKRVCVGVLGSRVRLKNECDWVNNQYTWLAECRRL